MTDYAFQLRIRLHTTPAILAIVTAYDDGVTMGGYGHQRLDIEVRANGVVVFPRGQLYVGIPSGKTTDGYYARNLVVCAVAMRPSAGGGEGDEYYADYTAKQLAWCEAHGDAFDMAAESRYCDGNGGIRAARS